MGKLPRKYLIRRIILVVACLAVMALVIWVLSSMVNCVISCVSSQPQSSSESSSSTTETDSTGEPVPTEELSVAEQWLMAESAIDPNAWNLILVNDGHRMDETYEPPLAYFENTEFRVHPGVCEPLTQLLNAAENEGAVLTVYMSYRGYEDQKKVFDNKVAEIEALGYNEWDAPVRAAWEVPYPGASEHLTGLSVDLVPRYDTTYSFDSSFGETKFGQWMAEHCAEYGFILRYPADKEEQTGYDYEPWHLRYVGITAATSIMNRDLCLEEYLDEISAGSPAPSVTEEAVEASENTSDSEASND